MKHKWKKRSGEGYIDTCVLVLCAMLVIALAVKVLPVYVAKQQLGAHAEYLRDFYFSFKHKNLRHDPTVVRRGSDLHFAAYGAKTGDADENYPSHASYARTVHLKRRIHTSSILHICNIY